MNTSINYSGFVDMFMEPGDNFESCGYSDTNESIEKIYNYIESYKAGFNDREYTFYE